MESEKSDVEATEKLDNVSDEIKDATSAETQKDSVPEEIASFKVIFNKQKYDINYDLNSTIAQLKEHLQNVIGVPPGMQKVMVKGLAKDEKTLKESGITPGTKVMVVGSTINDVLAVSGPASTHVPEEKQKPVASKEPLCQQKIHRKILDKGVPEDAPPGIRNAKETLPQLPLSGMLNRSGGKVRLTFKLEHDQLWIGTKERTEKISMSSIKTVVSEPIEGHEEYHIMGIQLGPTEASRYWVYWVPAQYVDAIKDAILGKFHYF